MPFERQLFAKPQWTALSPDNPEPVLVYECAMMRNLTDFVFPERCGDDERRAIVQRVTACLAEVNHLWPGRCHAFSDMDEATQRCFAERRLVTYEMLCASGPRGVFVADNQSITLMINALDHLTLRGIASHGGLEQVWHAVNTLDDVLSRMLDFAWHERLGYLTSSLRMVGTGMKMSVLLHLPALAMQNAAADVARRLEGKRLSLRGVLLGDPRLPARGNAAASQDALCAAGMGAEVEPGDRQCLYADLLDALTLPPERGAGNLFLLSNQDTLGISDQEMIFYMQQAVAEIIEDEEYARHKLMRNRKEPLLDCIGRALGIACGARLLGFREALAAASLIRLAHALGIVAGFDRAALNVMLVECQSAHLQLMRGIPPDGAALAQERARLFRSLFAEARIN